MQDLVHNKGGCFGFFLMRTTPDKALTVNVTNVENHFYTHRITNYQLVDEPTWLQITGRAEVTYIQINFC